MTLFNSKYFYITNCRSKIRSSRPRNDSIATIKLEDLFGTATVSRPSPTKYAYPNTVPQAKGSTLQSMGLSEDDVKPGYASASVAATKRRSQQFSFNNKYVIYSLIIFKSICTAYSFFLHLEILWEMD